MGVCCSTLLMVARLLGTYAGLPDDPKISPIVGFWKGVMKPISLAAIAFAGVFGFLHYITKGPNEVSEADQRKGDELAGGKHS